jgi:hypothetical protein
LRRQQSTAVKLLDPDEAWRIAANCRQAAGSCCGERTAARRTPRAACAQLCGLRVWRRAPCLCSSNPTRWSSRRVKATAPDSSPLRRGGQPDRSQEAPQRPSGGRWSPSTDWVISPRRDRPSPRLFLLR